MIQNSKEKTIVSVSRECPICNHDRAYFLHKQKFAKLKQSPIITHYNIVSCLKCGFVYADTESLQSDYDAYYRYISKYQDVSASGSGTSVFDSDRLKQSAQNVEKYLPNKQATILDIGCANGGLLNELKKRGYINLTGVDPSEICVQHIRKLGIEAFRGNVFEEMPRKKFDCIILTHALEHIRDLDRAIENVRGILNIEGLIYIELPNAGEYKSCYVVPYYYFDCEHINHFDSQSIRNLLKDMKCVCLEEIVQPVGEKINYPVLRGAFINSCLINQRINYSEEGMMSVKEYIYQSSLDDKEQAIRDIVDSQCSVIIWGAGQYTLRLLETTCLNKCNIISFVDNDSNKQGKSIGEILIRDKKVLKGYEGTIIVASAINRETIIEEIQALGIKNDIIVI